MQMGFKEVYALEGGLQEWRKADYPLEAKKAVQQNCLACHEHVTPGVVREWESSRHAVSAHNVTCSVCHGTDHTNATDVDQARIPTAKRCRFCHEENWQSFQQGKHALAWKSKEELPEYHYSREYGESASGEKTCAQCHKIGLKSASTTERLWHEQGISGANSCANCHTGHAYSGKEASRPQACRPCHSGTQTPQWEAYTGSRHFEVIQKNEDAPAKSRAPTCQTCHLSDGSHGVQTAWGSIGLRLPLPSGDAEWSQARTDILTALRAYSPQNGTEKLLVTTYRRLRFFPVKDVGWKEKRRSMLRTCSQCHEQGFAENRLQEADRSIRVSDLLLARGITVLEGLYSGGYLEHSDRYPFPSLIGAPGATDDAEKILREMFYIHRKGIKSGSFHAPGSNMEQKGLRALLDSLDRLREIRDDLESRE